MKTITLWQPWAALVALEGKKVETRIWQTKYRGPLAIHSALSVPAWLGKSRQTPQFELAAARVWAGHGQEAVHAATRGGCIVAVCNLVDIRPTEQVVEDLSEQEQIFGNYELGRYAWFLEKVVRLEEPIPVKGNRMLWNWDGLEAQRLAERLPVARQTQRQGILR